MVKKSNIHNMDEFQSGNSLISTSLSVDCIKHCKYNVLKNIGLWEGVYTDPLRNV